MKGSGSALILFLKSWNVKPSRVLLKSQTYTFWSKKDIKLGVKIQNFFSVNFECSNFNHRTMSSMGLLQAASCS